MSSGVLVVVEGGPRTLVADRGRPGYEHLGLPRGGAADTELHAAALLLVETAADAATLECTVSGPTLECRDAPVRVGLAGECGLRHTPVGEVARDVPAWRSLLLRPGDRLRVGRCRGPLRAYLGVAGGIAVPAQLGSRSSSLRGGLTGMLGRALRAGDVLPVGGTEMSGDRELEPPPGLLRDAPLRVCVGPGAGVLDGEVGELLAGRPWRVSTESDRTGVRLEGMALALRHGGADVASMGSPPGAVQVGGDGLPIVLGRDRGTTGGYAVVGVVVSADLPQLGRLRPGDEVGFEVVDVERAVALRRARELLLASLEDRVRRV